MTQKATKSNRAQFVQSKDDVAAIVHKLGLELVFFDGEPDTCNVDDPDAVYLIVPKKGLCRYKINESSRIMSHDAKLLHKGKSTAIFWNETTRSSIRKVLENSNDECAECSVEPVTDTTCNKCHRKLCTVCQLKSALTTEMLQKVRTKDFELDYECACGQKYEFDIRQMIVPVMDRVDEFSAAQQDTLSFVKNNFAMYEEQRKGWRDYVNMIVLGRELQFRKGRRVILRGFNGESCNGKRAEIVAKRIVRDGVIRWPVRLLDGSNSKAFLKQVNMKKIEAQEEPPEPSVFIMLGPRRHPML